jgi:hypothetical protein
MERQYPLVMSARGYVACSAWVPRQSCEYIESEWQRAKTGDCGLEYLCVCLSGDCLPRLIYSSMLVYRKVVLMAQLDAHVRIPGPTPNKNGGRMHTKADGSEDSADKVETHDVLLTQYLHAECKIIPSVLLCKNPPIHFQFIPYLTLWREPM